MAFIDTKIAYERESSDSRSSASTMECAYCMTEQGLCATAPLIDGITQDVIDDIADALLAVPQNLPVIRHVTKLSYTFTQDVLLRELRNLAMVVECSPHLIELDLQFERTLIRTKYLSETAQDEIYNAFHDVLYAMSTKIFGLAIFIDALRFSACRPDQGVPIFFLTSSCNLFRGRAHPSLPSVFLCSFLQMYPRPGCTQ